MVVVNAGKLAAQRTLPDAPAPVRKQIDIDASPGPFTKRAMGCQPNASTPADSKMSCAQSIDPFQRFLSTSLPRPLTPRDKLHLALRNSFDPFNLLTIAATSAISVADNAESPYGPGLEGFGKNAGVAFTQELTSQFFGTFLIPSIAHQDPHYHRMPNASIKRRIWHAAYQVVWTQGDNGQPMFNYATVFGTIADDAISDIYVPQRRIGVGASAARISIDLATDPTSNLITEFLPDVANHFNFHVLFVQRIINRVAIGSSGTTE